MTVLISVFSWNYKYGQYVIIMVNTSNPEAAAEIVRGIDFYHVRNRQTSESQDVVNSEV